MCAFKRFVCFAVWRHDTYLWFYDFQKISEQTDASLLFVVDENGDENIMCQIMLWKFVTSDGLKLCGGWQKGQLTSFFNGSSENFGSFIENIYCVKFLISKTLFN